MSPSRASPATKPGRAIPGSTAEPRSGPPAPTIPELNLTYWGTGNAGPDFDGDARAGDNLYCNSVHRARRRHRARSNGITSSRRTMSAIGMRRRFRCWPTFEWQGQRRKVMMWGNRNGVFYVLDRATGKFLLGKPLTTINWLGGFDENGRPIWADGKLPQPGGEAVTLYPGVEGGTSWYSPSFSPRTGLFYVSTWDDYHQSVRKPS